MKGKNFLVLVSIFFVALSVAALPFVGACTPEETALPAEEVPHEEVTSTPKPEPIQLKVVTFVSSESSVGRPFMVVIDQLNERCEGELVLDYLGGPEVIEGHDQAEAVMKGTVDISFVPSCFYEGLVPEGAVLQVSRITPAEERQRGLTDVLNPFFQEVGLFYLGRANPMSREQFNILSNKRVETLEDFAGMKLGATGLFADAFAKGLRADYIIVEFTEVYTAMDRGVIDAYTTSVDNQPSLGVHEVAKYAIEPPFFKGNSTMIMNLNTWNHLSDHLKDLILDTLAEVEPELDSMHGDLQVEAIEKTRAAGVEFIRLSPPDDEGYVELAYQCEIERILEISPDHGSGLIEIVSP